MVVKDLGVNDVEVEGSQSQPLESLSEIHTAIKALHTKQVTSKFMERFKKDTLLSLCTLYNITRSVNQLGHITKVTMAADIVKWVSCIQKHVFKEN